MIGASRARHLAAAAAVAALIALPASAQANAYQSVLGTYTQNGSIPPCKFLSSTLAAAMRESDTYDAQYLGDFTNAIQAALNSRAGGACGARTSASSLPEQTAPLAGHLPASITASTEADLPAPIVLMAVIAGVLSMIALSIGVARNRGWDPAWAAAARHAWGEAELRISGAWAEFRDWAQPER